jgi:peptidoglycan/LPS O-acetylase OafA/YrhL
VLKILIRLFRQVLRDCLDSIRGLAALSVVFCHLLWAFYPYMNSRDSTVLIEHSTLAILLSLTPLRVIYDGSFAVSIFFVLSGFVLSFSFIHSHDVQQLSNAAIRRYIRLVFPIAVSVLFAFSLQASGLLWHRTAADLSGNHVWLNKLYNFYPSLENALREGLYGSFFAFNESTSYNPVLWTMAPELFGSFFVFGFLSLFGQLRCRWVLYCCFILIFLCLRNFFLLNFLFGMMLCNLYKRAGYSSNSPGANKDYKVPAVAWTYLLILGVVLGSFSSFIIPASLQNHFLVDDLRRSFGAVAIIAGILFCPFYANLMKVRAIAFLGKISFSLYLLHLPIICSLVSWLYCVMRQSPYYLSHDVSAFASSIIGLIVMFFTSYLMFRFVDCPSITAGRLLYDKHFAPRKQD